MSEEHHRLTRILHRLTASQSELYAEQVRKECKGLGCVPISGLVPGSLAVVAGRVTTVQFVPVASMPVLEVTLFDGTDTVILAWLGRRRIVGVEPGRRLIATGRVALREPTRKVIFNPQYALVNDEPET